MPKNLKKKDARRHLAVPQADITLNDFANSNSSGRKLKKPATNAITREVKQLQLHTSSEDHLDWFEKDYDDYVFSSTEDENALWSEDVEQKPTSKHTRKGNNKVQKKKLVEEDTGQRYPLDVWFLISEYLYPEDIAVFACICKDALTVVSSMKFWLSIYKRYYKRDANLPMRLQPECMERPRSLRACVIRSLYYTYPLFVDRIRMASAFDDKTHLLVKRRCVLMWYQKVKNLWNFNFKFRTGAMKFEQAERKDLLELLDDIHANSEEGCQVLQVSCKHFIPTPIVMGMILASVNLNTSQKMHHYRLRLTFDSTQYIKSTNGILVTLEPVANIRVLDWWHPQYPVYSK